jgi:acetolactate decarboxylase
VSPAALPPGATAAAPPPAPQRLYENAVFAVFAAGSFDGNVSVDALLKHGDLGLGAADKLDGELIVVDGHAYQARAGGGAALLPASGTTPWAAVTFFAPTKSIALDHAAMQADVEAAVDAGFPPNGAVAVKMTGTFRLLRVRAIPGPSTPYPTLNAAVATQVVVDLRDVAATLVGFRLPGCVQGWNVPGYHFHALTEDRSQGGHVLAYEVERGVIGVGPVTSFDLPKSAAAPEHEDPACPKTFH